MGTDRSDVDSPCLCGKGTINVETESPDHPWARESQTSWMGSLLCDVCAETYVVVNDYYSSRPFLALKADVEARDNARAEHSILSEKFRNHPLAKSIEPALIDEIDTARAKSMAAAHRVLEKYKLTYESLASYRKRPTTGEETVAAARGDTLASIGETLGATDEHRAAFKKVRMKLDQLQDAARMNIKPVKSGHPWMKA